MVPEELAGCVLCGFGGSGGGGDVALAVGGGAEVEALFGVAAAHSGGVGASGDGHGFEGFGGLKVSGFAGDYAGGVGFGSEFEEAGGGLEFVGLGLDGEG